MLKRVCLSLFFLLMSSICVHAITVNFNGFIADEADVLSSASEYDLNMTLLDLHNKTGVDIAVVTLNSTNEKAVYDIAAEIHKTYKIGTKGKDNGVVFVFSISDNKVALSYGSDLNLKTDDKLHDIQINDISPYFLYKHDYEKGILRGTYLLADIIAESEKTTITRHGTLPLRYIDPYDINKVKCCNKNYNSNNNSNSSINNNNISTGNSSSSSNGNGERRPSWIHILWLLLAPFAPRRRRGIRYGRGFRSRGSFGSNFYDNW